MSQVYLLTILHIIAGDDLKSFDMLRRLRSSSFSLEHVYCLYKIAAHLDEPPWTRVRSLLLKAIHFRDGPTPRQGRPLVIPLLAHHAFIELKRWVRNKVLNAKPYLQPFHVPKATIVAGKHPALHQLVYNHFQFMESCHWGTPPQTVVAVGTQACGQSSSRAASM